jgi:beta-phosphoglucomutase
MDGVLVDSGEAHYQAWCELGKEVGKLHPREFFQRTFGMHNREIIPLWLGDRVPPEELERLSVLKEALYRKIAARTLVPMDGILDLIDALRDDGFLLGVGTSGFRENVKLVLKVMGRPECFDAIVTGEDIREGKPDPEVFLKAAQQLGLPAGRCAVVEDAPQGVAAALAAGARAVAVTSTRRPEELKAAHLVVGSLRELSPRRLREIITGSDAPR